MRGEERGCDARGDCGVRGIRGKRGGQGGAVGVMRTEGRQEEDEKEMLV